jgi:hypothetical protein
MELDFKYKDGGQYYRFNVSRVCLYKHTDKRKFPVAGTTPACVAIPSAHCPSFLIASPHRHETPSPQLSVDWRRGNQSEPSGDEIRVRVDRAPPKRRRVAENQHYCILLYRFVPSFVSKTRSLPISPTAIAALIIDLRSTYWT